ncbi:Heparan sulfate 2-O-sulfotransferase pipe [Orchesella cincta]|uniref:Heparan sulfate 2-O-sulfotransferase pipe n=1 Tax=Orchesella cincta TaxID=48709 RepID=A0A1D2MY24_ORCCI|nr:Heparan sulfate 2-O-sulfotransferase pipe [Orchesella cincta]
MLSRFFSSEWIALASVSLTVFLFIHTQILTARIEEIKQEALTAAAAFSAHENHLSSASQEKSRGDFSGNNVHSNAQEQYSSDQQGGSSSGLQHHHRQYLHPKKKYNATALNNTRNSEKETLFFNRVPKVGSQTLMDLMQRLSIANGFQFHRDKTQKVETIKMTYYEESRLTTMVDMFTPPSVYVKHTCFSNFTRHGYSMPIYMNIVRDPIERVISWFYYIRAPWYIIERKQVFPELPLPHPMWLKKDFESCVLNGDRECMFIPGEYHDGVGDHRRQTMFFCGHDEKCVEFNGEWAMQKAKRNVEKHYAVVGVLEEMDITLKVLENYIPRFFAGASHVYHDNLSSMVKINKNMYKPPVSEQVKNILRQNFTNEIEFYEFCKQRLHMQHAAVTNL